MKPTSLPLNRSQYHPALCSPLDRSAERSISNSIGAADEMREDFALSDPSGQYAHRSTHDRSSLRNWLRAEEGERSPVPISLVLVVSPDWVLLESRCSILRGVGYIAESALSIDEGIRRFRESDFDLVLLCHTFPLEERERFTRLARAEGSRVPIVYLTSDADVAALHSLADANVECAPTKLLSELRQVLLQAGKNRIPTRTEQPFQNQ